MGCCSSSDYAVLDDEISLADNVLPTLPNATRLKDCPAESETSLKCLFQEFDRDGDGLISAEELHAGLLLLKKSPSKAAVSRIMKTAHLSCAPANTVEFKGFALALLSRRSLLYDFLYEGHDTKEELEREIEEERKKGKGWRGMFSG
ncbi:hypothetical protein TeGR_g6762 [Tetraparma gracilis]|jgi:Ca2+-binding EF-hand superfamily protein|uniref:EF-hand domain-containing protein n=1 Tax=Tetraparma gracilis TaxID=2962635 RepID=A0ABQ6NCA7_9STRA|nr:hypothetical protein TeGR_g6762 [Tetraparma gracilis]